MYIYLVYLYALRFEIFWFYVPKTPFLKMSVSFQSLVVALDQSPNSIKVWLTLF